MYKEKFKIAKDVEAVVTSFNQGAVLLEAVYSLCCQTTLPAKIVVVDDGSTDEKSISILEAIENCSQRPIPVTVLRRPHQGVSAARNAGIRMTQSSMVLILDGDDRIVPTYIEQVSHILRSHNSMVAASSWMHTFGVLEAEVCPSGGSIDSFLARNCCPAAHIFRREAWEQCGGYDESMRRGFEDWDFFLSMLETRQAACIGIVEKYLIEYRTAAVSANMKSMSKRLDLMRFLIEKHINSYRAHVTEVVLGIESISAARLLGWESEILCAMEAERGMSSTSSDFMEHPTYGDGGMAAAVHIASFQK